MTEILLGIVALAGISLLGFEWQYRSRPGNCLQLRNGTWEVRLDDPTRYEITGTWVATNPTDRWEFFIPEAKVELTCLSQGSLRGVQTQIDIFSQHPDQPISRQDNYWEAYIVKTNKSTTIQTKIAITGEDLRDLETAWIRLNYVVYGPAGREVKTFHTILPLQYPSATAQPSWRSVPNGEVLPIRTHILTPIDDPVAVIERYVLPFAQPGDIVTIGETPVAIMQERWRHPSTVHPGWLAKRLCYYFFATSSLATSCGLQVLVEEVGAWRVAFAFAVGALAKIFLGKPGVFYQLAGEQARLIDDVTGTLPPYDQFIVLGPQHPQEVVDRIKQATGLEAAIVDVNDLQAVKVVAATDKVSEALLNQALKQNPAGNANEQTPIVLVRPQP